MVLYRSGDLSLKRAALAVTFLLSSASSRGATTYSAAHTEMALSAATNQYARNDFAGCANNLTEVLTNELSPAQKSKAELYLAACRAGSGDNGESTRYLRRVNTKYLNTNDRILHDELVAALSGKTNDQIDIFIHPYLGFMRYAPEVQKKSAFFMGANAELAYQGLRFSAGGERLTVKFGDGAAGYQQNQGVGGVSYDFSNKFSARAKAAYIAGNQVEQSTAEIGGLGASYRFFETTRANLDFFYSNYPLTVVGQLGAYQGSLSIDQWIFSRPSFRLWFRLGAQRVALKSAFVNDPVTRFAPLSAYDRYSAALTLDLKDFQIGFGAWAGREAYGIRNNASLIFAAPEEHTGGWDFHFLGGPLEKFGVQYSVSQEFIATFDTAIRVDTGSVMLFMHL